MTSGPRVKWDSVKGEMKMMWTRWRPKRRWPTAGMRVRSQSQSTVRADRWTVGALPEIELPRGVAPTYPWGQVRGMCRAAEEMGHRVIGRVAVGEGRVIGPDYGMAVELEPRAVAGTELREGDSVRLEQQLFDWVHWKGSGHEHFVGCLRPDDLLRQGDKG